MSARTSIKIVHGALDENAEKSIIMRGVIDPDSFHLLQVAEYQREVLPLATIEKLCAAFEHGKVPDIELGMRGQRFTSDREETFYLQDPVFIIDGLQRVSAALHLMKKGGVLPHLGATVHFGTTEEWERGRFKILNADRTKLSPNVLARNLRHDFPSIELLLRLSGDSGFVLHNRICWSQRVGRGHLITAVSLIKTIGMLHSRFGPGRANNLMELARGLEKIMERVGRSNFKDNIRTYFDVIDEAWGVRRVAFKEGASYLRGTFRLALGDVFSSYQEFWRGSKLVVTSDWRKKLAIFPITDPMIQQLAGSGGQAQEMLSQMILKHLNSGKRTKRLTEIEPIRRNALSDPEAKGQEDESESEQA